MPAPSPSCSPTAAEPGGRPVSAPCLPSPFLAVLPGIPMEAARCQLGNLLTLPCLPKWTMSPLIRCLPRGQMSALLMAFLSSSLWRLLMASERSGPITSCQLLPTGLPSLLARWLCCPGGGSPTAPPTLGTSPPPLEQWGFEGCFLKRLENNRHQWHTHCACVCVCAQSWNRFSMPRQRLGGEAITEACPLRLMRSDSLFTGTLKSLPLSP